MNKYRVEYLRMEAAILFTQSTIRKNNVQKKYQTLFKAGVVLQRCI